jgi:hypothetical protein
MALVLIVGGLGVALAFLIADFAERLRHRLYEQRNRQAPDSQFKRYVTIAFAVLFVAWSAVAYL